MAPKANSEKDKKDKKDGYRVNIELKDQLNNIFYIDKINDKDSIMLKDYSFDDTTTTGTTHKKHINIFRDIYYLDNTVIQDLKTIFIKHTNKGPRSGERSYDYIDTREPIGDISGLMANTSELSELHKIFTTEEYSKLIRDNIIHFNSGTNSRVKQLNSKDAINKYVVDYYKYINNTKKTSDFDDDEKMDALMFYNVMYMLRNIYLKKQTILTNIQGEKYYVDEILFYDLPYIHMVKKDYDDPKKINIYLRIKTIPIIGIPVIKIHYIVDDLELQSLKLSAPRELKPVDLDKDFDKYSTMYIFDNFKYKQETDSMTAFFNSLKSEKRIDKIQELFFNADIVNKYKKRYYEQHKPKNKQEQDKKPRETATTEEAAAAKLAATLKAAEAEYYAAYDTAYEADEALNKATEQAEAAATAYRAKGNRENKNKEDEAKKAAEQARTEADEAINKLDKASEAVEKVQSEIKAKASAEEQKTPAEIAAKEKAARDKAEKQKAAKDKAEKEKAAREKAAETIKYNNINANILYLLRENFNLIDNKISIDNTSIDDTYIAYTISNGEAPTPGRNQTNLTVKYHSIMTNKKYDKYTNPKKEAIIKNIIAEHIKRFNVAYEGDNFFYADNRTDERLPATVYNIIVIFRTFKQDSAKKKPSLMRRYIGDECLSNAVELDGIFSKLFYRTLGLPDKYLYDKFVNLTTKKTSATTNATTSATTSVPNIPGLPNIPIPSATKGGKKNNTKKFRTKKFRAKKHNTRKYRKNKFRTKKVRTKLLNAL